MKKPERELGIKLLFMRIPGSTFCHFYPCRVRRPCTNWLHLHIAHTYIYLSISVWVGIYIYLCYNLGVIHTHEYVHIHTHFEIPLKKS